jgi:hypothetical protein
VAKWRLKEMNLKFLTTRVAKVASIGAVASPNYCSQTLALARFSGLAMVWIRIMLSRVTVTRMITVARGWFRPT